METRRAGQLGNSDASTIATLDLYAHALLRQGRVADAEAALRHSVASFGAAWIKARSLH